MDCLVEVCTLQVLSYIIFHIDCVSLWLIDCSSSWMSWKLWSLHRKCVAAKGQTGGGFSSSPGGNGPSAEACEPLRSRENLQTSTTKTSVFGWKHLHRRGGNLSDFHQTSFAAACSCHYREMVLVIVGKWQFILQNRIKTAWSCQSKLEMATLSASVSLHHTFICLAQKVTWI